MLVEQHPDELEGCTEAVGEVGGFSATVRGRRLYLIEAAEKGMAWMRLTARGRAGHGSMINHDNAVTRLAARGRPDRRPRVAGAADPGDGGAARGGRRASPAPRPRPENAEALVEEFGSAARMLGAVIRNTANPTMLGAGYKVNVIPTEATAHVDGRFLPGFEDEFFATLRRARAARASRSSTSSNQQPWETPYDGRLVDAMTRSILAEDPDAHRRAVPDERRHRRQALPQAGHALLRLRAAAAARPTSTSPRCSTASTSGCRWTRWSSAPGSSTGSSTRSELGS